jgi:hypothetical protein
MGGPLSLTDTRGVVLNGMPFCSQTCGATLQPQHLVRFLSFSLFRSLIAPIFFTCFPLARHFATCHVTPSSHVVPSSHVAAAFSPSPGMQHEVIGSPPPSFCASPWGMGHDKTPPSPSRVTLGHAAGLEICIPLWGVRFLLRLLIRFCR